MHCFEAIASVLQHGHAAEVGQTHRPACRTWRSCVVIGVCLVAMAGGVANAVDGYKDFKFGMNVRQALAKSSVKLEEVNNAGFTDTWGNDCTVLASADFPFLGQNREINLVFTRKGLASVIFVLHGSEFAAVAKTLAEKYGQGTLHPSASEFQKLASRFDSGQPNVGLKISFDEDSVVLLGVSDKDSDKTFLLTYVGREFMNLDIQQSAKDDL
jgi:hypothetical protein